jgi:hypothetical protein
VDYVLAVEGERHDKQKKVRARQLLFRWKEGVAWFTTTFENKNELQYVL